MWGAQVAIVVAYVGKWLPWRVLKVTTYDEASVRRSIAGIGAIAIGLVIWLAPMPLDLVRAVGYVLLPIVFATAVLRGPAHPWTAAGWRLYLLVAGVFTALAFGAFVLLAMQPRVETDFSRIGLPRANVGITTDDLEVNHWNLDRSGGPARSDVWVWADTEESGDLPIAVTSVAIEAWPAEMRDDALRIANAPILTKDMKLDRRSHVRWQVPAPRGRGFIVVAAVATLPDGRRVILDAEPAVTATPMRHGSLASWWFGI